MPDRYGIPTVDEIFGTKKKGKRQITNAQKIWCWEKYSHTCNICGKRVMKFSDAEFDHTRAHSKGGASSLVNVKITHRQCNRLKGTKTLSETKKMLGVKTKKTTKKKTTKKKSTRKKSTRKKDPYGLPTIKIPKPPKFNF